MLPTGGQAGPNSISWLHAHIEAMVKGKELEVCASGGQLYDIVVVAYRRWTSKAVAHPHPKPETLKGSKSQTYKEPNTYNKNTMHRVVELQG